MRRAPWPPGFHVRQDTVRPSVAQLVRVQRTMLSMFMYDGTHVSCGVCLRLREPVVLYTFKWYCIPQPPRRAVDGFDGGTRVRRDRRSTPATQRCPARRARRGSGRRTRRVIAPRGAGVTASTLSSDSKVRCTGWGHVYLQLCIFGVSSAFLLNIVFKLT